MSPDEPIAAVETPSTQTTSPASAPLEPEDQPDPFRHVVEVASGPNTSGYDDLVKAAHALPPETDAPPAADASVPTESAIESATAAAKHDAVAPAPAPQEG